MSIQGTRGLSGNLQPTTEKPKPVKGPIPNPRDKAINTAALRTMNGDVFEGGFDEERRLHGKGKLTTKNGVFSGQWVQGKLSNGCYTDSQGNSYEGDFNNLNFDGNGVYKYASGDTFSGVWQKGEKNGVGTYTGNIPSGNKSAYKGIWEKDDLKKLLSLTKFDGKHSKSCYEGPFNEEWDPHGLGCLTITKRDKVCAVCKGTWKFGKFVEGEKQVNGDVFEGVFDENLQLHGEGKLTTKNGVFSGQWVHGKLKNGLHKDSEGNSYQGNFNNNLDYHGKGTLRFPNGDSYKGDFVNGAREGSGVLVTQQNGCSYTGAWLKGKMSRTQTIIVYPDKTVYEGPVNAAFLAEGKGIFTSTEGWTCEGHWKNGGWQIQSPHTISYPNETVYEFITEETDANGQPHRKGKWTFKNGDVYEGMVDTNKQPCGEGVLTTASFIFNGKWEEGGTKLDGIRQPTESNIESQAQLHEGSFKKCENVLLPHGQGCRTTLIHQLGKGAQGTPRQADLFLKKISGVWNEGKISTGEIQYKSNIVYRGEIGSNGTPHGLGTLRNEKEGYQLKSEWYEGQLRCKKITYIKWDPLKVTFTTWDQKKETETEKKPYQVYEGEIANDLGPPKLDKERQTYEGQIIPNGEGILKIYNEDGSVNVFPGNWVKGRIVSGS